jgi:hypothetical protein
MTQSPILKILSSTLTSDEKESVWLAAQARADGVHCTDLTVLVGSMAVPHEDPHWDYQDPSMLATQNYMLTCLIEGLQTASYRAVNFDKLRVIIQCPTENPADFLGHLTEALNRQRMALKPPRYLITEMRLETSKRPTLGGCPEAISSNFETGRTTMHASRGLKNFKCNQMGHWAKNCPSPHPPPVPCP